MSFLDRLGDFSHFQAASDDRDLVLEHHRTSHDHTPGLDRRVLLGRIRERNGPGLAPLFDEHFGV